MSEIDLSGRWSGSYSYPVAKPPVPFEAELQDRGGGLTGTISESHEFTGESLASVLDGHRSGRSVTFAKMYERADEDYDSVHYSGAVGADGDEISGRWRIPGNWSGTFQMVRAPSAKATVADEASERV